MTLLELFELLKKHMKLVVDYPLSAHCLLPCIRLLECPIRIRQPQACTFLPARTSLPAISLLIFQPPRWWQTTSPRFWSSNCVQNATADDLGLKNLSDFEIFVSSATTSRVIELSVTGTDPQQVAEVANAIADNVSAISQDVMKVQAVNIIDQAVAPQAPSGPKRPLYVAVACMGGLFAAVAIVVVADMLNMKVRSAEEVEELLGVPVIGRIPLVKGGRSMMAKQQKARCRPDPYAERDQDACGQHSLRLR